MSKTTKLRIMLSLGGFMLFVFAMIVRLIVIQFVDGASLKEQAVEQQMRDKLVGAKRGTIYDRKNVVLAQSVSVKTVSISPKIIAKEENIDEVVTVLSKILEIPEDTIRTKAQKNTWDEIVKRKVSKEISDEILKADLKGVSLTDDTKRLHPFSNFASQVLGFTGDDNQGLEGIERVFDDELSGIKGRVKAATDSRGNLMPFQHEIYQDPVDGNDVILTIDEVIQHYAERHLETAVLENRVQAGGACIVMDTASGEILAMAVKPDYDLTEPFAIGNEEIENQLKLLSGEELSKARGDHLAKRWRNKAVADTYEPGSTFKIITSAIALEENLVQLSDRFSCSGSKRVSSFDISCHKAGGHGLQTFVEGVQNSCNPVFMEVGARIGNTMFKDYMQAFGFMQKTGFDLPGEAKGIFFEEGKFNEVELATTSFGQGPQVTPLQLITAVGAVANDGKLMRPHIVKQISDKNGNIVKSFDSGAIRQVISSKTSEMLREILESVVSVGTGVNAYVPGYRIAGKTGTSEKVPRGSKKRIASFIGFAPADNPRVVCLLLLDEPDVPLYFGGVIAAPVVKNILDDTLQYLGVERQFTEEEKQNAGVFLPDYRDVPIDKVKRECTDMGLHVKVMGEGSSVVSQTPRAGTQVQTGVDIYLYTEESIIPQRVTVPNVINKTALQSNQTITNEGLNFKTSSITAGSGATVAVQQDPPAGSVVDIGTLVTVEFRHLEVD